MPIRNQTWRMLVAQDVAQRLSFVHANLTTIVGQLRDAGFQVWTESPTDQSLITLPAGSLQGWHIHYKTEGLRLAQFNADHGATLATVDQNLADALTAYVASMPTIVAAFAQAIGLYKDGNGDIVQKTVTMAHRSALANAIEAELE